MFYLISRLVCTTSGFVYPTYASYKAIKSNDLQTLEVWLMYWVVMGSVMALESTVEWIFAWFPFYYEMKTLVILWLTLPQIQGSTYIYVAHVHPFLASHEKDIDAALADAKVKAKQVGLEWLNKAIARIKQTLVGTLAPALMEDQGAQNAVPTHPSHPSGGAPLPPTNGFYSLANNYIRQYGPAAVAAGSALLHPMNSVSRPGPAPRERTTSTMSARQRRAELERELASLNAPSSSPSAMSEMSSGPRSASSSSTSLGLGPAPYQRGGGQPPYHPRSVSSPGPYPSSLTPGNNPYPYAKDGSRTPSPNPPPRDPVAARIERSFVGGHGFEEIGRDEASDSAEDYPPQSGPGNAKKGWWFWGGGGGALPTGPAGEPLLGQKKDE